MTGESHTLGVLRVHVTVVLLNLTALGGIVWWLRGPAATEVLLEPAAAVVASPHAAGTPAAPGADPQAARADPGDAPLLVIQVSGAVALPGVVEVRPGARGWDAVQAAGGILPDAELAAVNLAAVLEDGQHVHVPVMGEAPPPAIASGGGGSTANAAGGPAPPVSTGLININTATAAELETLPGIGPALAARIVDHRAANGPFAGVDSLLSVSGIGARTLARFRDRVATE